MDKKTKTHIRAMRIVYAKLQVSGYGFAGAVVLTSTVGLAILLRKLEQLEYETFMLQRVAF